MDTRSLKWILSAVILVVKTAASALPFCLKAAKWVDRSESLAAGIFLAASLVHLLPEGFEAYEDSKYRIPSFIAISALLVMFIIEFFLAGHHHEEIEDVVDSLENEEKPEADTSFCKAASDALTFYFVLIFHGFVEAVALGITNDQELVWALFFALIGHKPVETYVLGLNFVRCKAGHATYILLMGIFILVTPVTIISFMYIGQNVSESVVGAVTSASAGVFIYIGIMEIAPTIGKLDKMELSEKFWHIGFLAFGFGWMILVSIFGK